jgi:uncharacterized protein YkwD
MPLILLTFVFLLLISPVLVLGQDLNIGQAGGPNAHGDHTALARPRIIVEVSDATIETTTAEYELERHAFMLLNEQRTEHGLQPLVWHDEVAKIARIHSQSMAENKYFGHKGVDGSMVDNRAEKLGLTNWRAIGENIAYIRGFESPAETAVDRWMKSVSHRQNLLDERWKESAVGITVAADGTYYFTQVFLLRK